eukprot:CAMPEP_0174264520 /NCGR_PEP_ID=MMETSP0439-20130205/22749_1 /TAXON_ID=0 /ORGANISM="Stereomyxa ramosa, Strain Chinc5" /LENGTH=341 /DNA_ID=CAMNT_0015350429 /DNA_START=1018 /DNA_END=2043 /DNA_ORIENTATION=-
MRLYVQTGGQAFLKGNTQPDSVTLAPNSSLVGPVRLKKVHYSLPLWHLLLTENDLDSQELVSLMKLLLGSSTLHMCHSLCQTVLFSCAQNKSTLSLHSDLGEFLEINKEKCKASRDLFSSKFSCSPIGDNDKSSDHLLSRYVDKINAFFSEYYNNNPDSSSTIDNDTYQDVLLKCLFLLVDRLASKLPSRETRHDGGSVSYSNVTLDHDTITRVVMLLLKSIKDKAIEEKDELLLWKYTALADILGLYHRLFTTVLHEQAHQFRKFIMEEVQDFLQGNWGDLDHLPGSDASSSPTLKSQLLLFVTLIKDLSSADFFTANCFFPSPSPLVWDKKSKRYVVKP